MNPNETTAPSSTGKPFAPINPAYNRTFRAGELSLGVVVPIENYAQSPIPALDQHLERAQLVEELGFAALWLRDVPLQVPSFGDGGQTFDPFTYLGYLAAGTRTIGLGISSIALPLHHPVHVAKSAATIDQLSQGRMILGVASGDRPDEYPALGVAFEQRGELFRESFAYIRAAQKPYPRLESQHFGHLTGRADILPKPFGKRLPLLITGSSRQSMEWNARHGDGWMSYPRNLHQQQSILTQWRDLIDQYADWGKPFMQPLYVDLHPDADYQPRPIHLGFRIGVNYLVAYLQGLKQIGVNHVALNLRFNSAPIPRTLETLARQVLPFFPTFQPTTA